METIETGHLINHGKKLGFIDFLDDGTTVRIDPAVERFIAGVALFPAEQPLDAVKLPEDLVKQIIVKGNAPVSFLERFCSQRNGSLFKWVLFQNDPDTVPAHLGQNALHVIVYDVTDPVDKALRKLCRAENIHDNRWLAEGIWIHDDSARLIAVNERIGKMLGRDATQMPRMSLADVVPDFNMDAFRQVWSRSCSQGDSDLMVGNYITSDGYIRPVRVFSCPVKIGPRVFMRASALDVNDSEDRYKRMASGMQKVVDIANRLMALESEDAVLRGCVEAARSELGIERCAILLQVGNMVQGTWRISREGKLMDGHSISFPVDDWWQWVSSPDDASDTFWRLMENVPHHELCDGRLNEFGRGWRVATPIMQSNELLGVFLNDSAISGNPYDPVLQEFIVVLCSMLSGIIVRKRSAVAERRLQEELRQSEKMRAIGQLASGIAHDFNNQLSVIRSVAGMIDAYGADQDLNECARDILSACSHAGSLCSKLLAFANKKRWEKQPVDLHAVIADTVEIVMHSMKRQYNTTTRCDAAGHIILAEAGDVENILLNLVLNARDAMPDGGDIIISTQNISRNGNKAAADFVRLTVTDKGIGMDESLLSRIFEPFFTTKGRERNTGLGLSMVTSSVKEYDGFVAVKSTPGKGTTFSLDFPCYSGLAQPAGD